MTRKVAARSERTSRFPYVQVPLPLIYDSRLSSEEKVVLLALFSRCIEHDFTVVSADRLAEDLGISIRWVKQHLSNLRKKGWLKIVRRGNGRTSRKSVASVEERYHPVVLRYPYFFLRHRRTVADLGMLRSEVAFSDDSGEFVIWLNDRVREAEGEGLITLDHPEVNETAPLVRIRGELECTQNRSRDLGTDQDKAAARPDPSPEKARGHRPESESRSCPLTTVPGCGMEAEMENSGSDRPVPTAKARIGNLADVVEQAKSKARKANEKRLERSLQRDKRLANLAGSDVPVQQKKSVTLISRTWMEELEKKHPDVVFGAWGPKERGICRNLLDKYPCQVILTAVRYVIRRWDNIETRYFKRSGSFPTIGFLIRFHDAMFPEAQRWEKFAAVQDEWDQWFREHPDKRPPSDLSKRYMEMKAALAG